MSRTRRNLYRIAADLSDIEAASRGPGAYAKRRARRAIYKAEGRTTRRILRKLGL